MLQDEVARDIWLLSEVNCLVLLASRSSLLFELLRAALKIDISLPGYEKMVYSNKPAADQQALQ